MNTAANLIKKIENFIELGGFDEFDIIIGAVNKYKGDCCVTSSLPIDER